MIIIKNIIKEQIVNPDAFLEKTKMTQSVIKSGTMFTETLHLTQALIMFTRKTITTPPVGGTQASGQAFSGLPTKPPEMKNIKSGHFLTFRLFLKESTKSWVLITTIWAFYMFHRALRHISSQATGKQKKQQ